MRSKYRLSMKNISKIRDAVVALGISLQVVCIIVFIFTKKTLFISVGVPIALVLIVIGCFYIRNANEKRQSKIDYEDERNTLIRLKSHCNANNVMVYIGLVVVIVLILLKYYFASVMVSSAIVLDGVLVCLFGRYHDRRM